MVLTQSQDMKITIIGKTPHEKGLLFESLIQDVLSRQGYGNFEGQRRRNGMELDLTCINNITNKKILVEAKARQNSISQSELEQFYGRITSLKKDFEVSIFWSLGRINP